MPAMDYSIDLGLAASPWRGVGKSGEKGKGRKLLAGVL